MRDYSLKLLVRPRINGDIYLLTYIQVFDLSLLIIGDNPLLLIGKNVCDGLPCIYQLTYFQCTTP